MAADLTGKVVLITGATDGLGRGTAIALAQRGATVLVHARDRARGETVLAEVQAAGCPDPRLYLADFGVLADIREMADAILASESRLHALVNSQSEPTSPEALVNGPPSEALALTPHPK